MKHLLLFYAILIVTGSYSSVCVCQLMLLAKSITGEECARQLVTAISTEFSISSELLVAAIRDRARVNDVAMRTISVIYNNMMDVKCFSHTLDRVGDKMATPTLDDFIKGWISLFAHSPKARLAWKTYHSILLRNTLVEQV